MRISTKHKGEVIAGKITYLTKYCISVEVTSPHTGKTGGSSMPYFGRPYEAFEGEYLDKTCHRLLVEI